MVSVAVGEHASSQHADKLLILVQDPYFPHGQVDIRYVTQCEELYEKDIRLKTHQKTIRLSADSAASRDEWMKVIRKIMFKAQNAGDNVKVNESYFWISVIVSSYY